MQTAGGDIQDGMAYIYVPRLKPLIPSTGSHCRVRAYVWVLVNSTLRAIARETSRSDVFLLFRFAGTEVVS